jgi:Flp pilus assembly protein TadG
MKRFRFIKGQRFADDESGTALAELAILIPFLIVMVAAVAEVGRLFQAYNTVSKSTRAAARYLSNVAYHDPEIAKAKNIALCGKPNCTGADPVASGLKLSNIVVTPEFKPGGGGNPITVTISVDGYNFEPLFNLPALLQSQRFAALPVKPSTTMYYMWVDPAGAEE